MEFGTRERSTLLALEGFGVISAVAGAIGLIGGGIKYPTEWLVGTPFSSYVGPGLILGIVVGGSQLAAVAALLRRVPWDTTLAGLAGLVMAGWIAGEVLLVGSRSGIMASLQIIYFLLGMLELAIAGLRRYAIRSAG